ncbi:hypothetical protein ACQ7HM_00300 [Williamsia sp. MIQD14]|uniref:hypothetical protein n=1 Tax=Williamsia sp. MIQD14 TaxID=3425703 RepID=UPI003DA17F4F
MGSMVSPRPAGRQRRAGGVHRLLSRANGPLSPERASARLSAYIYGTLLALAAVVVVDPAAIENGSAVLVVLGTTATTFLAHVFAEIVAGHSIPEATAHLEEPVRRRVALEELRDAVPIASAGAFPAFFLALGWLDVLEPTWAFVLAGAGPILRMALVEIMIGRIRGQRPTLRVLVGGVATAVVAAAIVAVKVILTH